MELLYRLAYGVSAQRPDHSLFVGGVQLPLEARMAGIFAGFTLGVFYLVGMGKWRNGAAPSRNMNVVLLGLFGLMGVDGLNATLLGRTGTSLYEPQNWLRLATGLGGGLALAAWVLPAWASATWVAWEPEPSLDHPAELVVALGLLAMFATIVLVDLPVLLLPVSLFLVASPLFAFCIANAYLLALCLRWRAEGPRQLWKGMATGAAMAAIQMGALGTLRRWMELELGVRWVA